MLELFAHYNMHVYVECAAMKCNAREIAKQLDTHERLFLKNITRIFERCIEDWHDETKKCRQGLYYTELERSGERQGK